MTESLAPAAGGRWWPVARFCFRTGRRTLVESGYLLTGPVTAAAGLLLVLGGLGLGAAGRLLPGRPRLAARALAPARWPAGLERWRIAAVRAAAGPRGRASNRPPRPEETASPADPGRWLGVAHAVLVFPVTLVTAVLTGVWWFAGLGAVTAALRDQYTPGSLRPQTQVLGSAQYHIAVSLGPMSAAGRAAFGTGLGLLVLATLPLVTRVCTAVQARLGQALLSDESALHRRISGLEQERDTARAQTVAAVTAEATALRRLERDLHDGPQQRLVRLAMELGRAQHNFDRRPEAARVALADALVQTQEALDELRALSHGIAPPILVDRGLGEALTALAARSTIPIQLNASALDGRPDAAVETAAYFVVAEALTNVAKHSQASRCTVGLRHGSGVLRVWVSDDGVGGAALDKGHGLRGLEDRLHAVGGRLSVTSPDGGPTTITAELPCG
jgi:signal transduction histidine kinase